MAGIYTAILLDATKCYVYTIYTHLWKLCQLSNVTRYSKQQFTYADVRQVYNIHFSPCSLLSSAYDVVLRQKVAVKKLSRPFQSLIHSRRSYRELRLLKHMKHENVSAPYKNTLRQTDAALCMFPLCY